MEQDLHKTPKQSKGKDTGNKNKRLNKNVLGNVKHRLFEAIMEAQADFHKTDRIKAKIDEELQREKISQSSQFYREYQKNLIIFSSNCIFFKKKYLLAQRPFRFQSSRVF